MNSDAFTGSQNTVEQYNLFKIIVLHFAPGLVAVLLFIILAPIFISSGLPSVFALFSGLMMSFSLIFIFLLYQGKKTTGTLSIKAVLMNCERLKFKQYIIIVSILIIWSLVIGGLLTPINNTIINRFFSWLPQWFWWTKQFENLGYLSMVELIILFFMLLIGNAFIGPIIEEVYFRAYLLPRMGKFGTLAPLLSVILFSIYHFFSPEQNIARLLILTPIVYAVWWKKSIFISILTHCIMNLMPSLLVLSVILSKV